MFSHQQRVLHLSPHGAMEEPPELTDLYYLPQLTE